MSREESGPKREQPSVEEVLAKIEQSPLGPLLRDEKAAERMMFDLMTRSDDEVVREMGRELREGNITLRGLGDIPAYREALQAGFDRMAELDLGAMSGQLDELIAEQQRQETEQAPHPEDEEPDELFQGIWTDKRHR